MSSFVRAVGYASVGFASLTAGGIWAGLKPPATRWRRVVQHVAAGTVFAGLVVGVLSRLLQARPHAIWLVLGLLAGLALMMWIRVKGEGAAGTTLGFTIIADVITDGVLMGLIGVSGDGRSLLLVLGFIPEMTLLGATVALEFGGSQRWRKILIPALIGCAVVAGGAIGGWARSGPQAITTGIEAFGTVAISYLVVEELLREAHRSGDSPWLAAMFFLGFIPLFAAGVLLH